jgi:hypothetical protein
MVWDTGTYKPAARAEILSVETPALIEYGSWVQLRLRSGTSRSEILTAVRDARRGEVQILPNPIGNLLGANGRTNRPRKDSRRVAGRRIRDRCERERLAADHQFDQMVLTPGPIRAGTRLRDDRIMFGRDSIQVMQVATIERPHRLRLFIEHPDLHYELDHLIDAVYGGGCRISLVFRSRPETPARGAVHPS